MDIHYTWIGPYKAGITDRPSQMKFAVLDAATVYLWVLQPYLAEFQNDPRVSGGSIVVRSIDDHLRTVLGEHTGITQAADVLFRWYNWYGRTETQVAQSAKTLLLTGMNNSLKRTIPTKTKLREYVNIKNMWNYFLLYTWGGYVLDANVEAMELEPRLTTPGRLKCPRIEGQDGFASLYECAQDPHRGSIFATCMSRDLANINIERPGRYNRGLYMGGQTPIVDVWLLSSERYHADALRALRHYLFLMHGVYHKFQELIFGDRAPDEIALNDYHATCADAVVEALLTGMIMESARGYTERVDWRARTWETRSEENRKTVLDFNFRKTLERSHI